MKYINIKTLIAVAVICMLSPSCKKILEEQPRSIYEPGFFKTEKGIRGGITSMYAHLRYIYGQAYYYNATLTGTDEVTYAQSADANFKDMDLSGIGQLTPSSSRADVLWGAALSNINTASGIIENASEVGVSDALVAEARFFRAFDYFQLVQTFGGVPLDLGSGELMPNDKPARTSVRNTVPEVYTKGVFPDLIKAVDDLPMVGRVTGGATKTLARLYLAKAYLTYAWWLENPNNIPTYPQADRTDPDGHNAQWYFQQAYDIAAEAIDNPGPFGLQATYYDVNVGTNDRNNEILLYADHTETSEFYNASSLTYSNGGAPENFAGWMMTWNYTDIRSGANADGSGATSSVQREADQHLGRPWTRMAPTIGAIVNTFADKTLDSRYDGTFVSVYRGNWPKGGVSNTVLYNANNLPVSPGDAILTFLNEEPITPIVYPSNEGTSNIGAGTLPGRSDYVVGPQGISRIVYPGLWKLGPYRTDNGDGLGQPNAASTRPFNIAKFSELYFVAAEAAVKGANVKSGKSARELINVIRARAGKWSWDNNGNVAKVEDNSAAMTALTPANITIDYILAERSREYYGEGYRWYDLVRTQKWNDLASSYKIAGTAKGDHTAVTVTRTIEPYHYLRPIPQGQIESMLMTPDEKEKYQNPGYN
ncbi:RagB/SusD family nutrient uptake outer membrane protein [Albibacterium bauzanense]|uniref:Putative outer membrane starch-binding protein n=1 Tax=Albibacterium bauzanense TaxID=653929 RepID=A0A4R1M0J0_9SPHI|nr:RagB/SusD family nutrient uptake outer membrane protein [Albibacterium bauzanense]TCK85408.1 putative outer membrane starch-binding protein [Albibacterium bauzanense]